MGFGDHLCEIVPTLKLNLGIFFFFKKYAEASIQMQFKTYIVVIIKFTRKAKFCPILKIRGRSHR